MNGSVVDIIIASLEIDGGSSKCLELCLETVESFTGDVPHTIVLERSTESASVNRNNGIQRSSSPFVCFLDDDAWVTPGWLSGLLEIMENGTGIGMAGPKLKTEDGRIFCFGLSFDPPSDVGPVGYGEDDGEAYAGLFEPFAIPTTCLLVRREAVESAGLFDTGYKSCQWEDIDYYLRLRKSGYRGLVTGAVTVYHQHLFRSNHYDENTKLFLDQWSEHLVEFDNARENR
jgi:GT2 family glycosyltransferase